MQAAGFVLVGGLSTRMGRDKALLSSGPQPLVQDVAQRVAVAAGSVTLIGRPERYQTLGLDSLTDLRPDSGPLAGVETALASHRADLNLIVACDMPGLTVTLLQSLLVRAQETGALCTVTRDQAHVIHPLCAVYRTACLPIVQRALDARRLRLMDVIEELQAVPCDVDSIVWNVNTPEEWSAWQHQHLSPEGAPTA